MLIQYQRVLLADETEDCVAVEAPLELRFGETKTTVLMRTPGDDADLVRGFLFNEGIIDRAEDILKFETADNVISVQLKNPEPKRLPQNKSSDDGFRDARVARRTDEAVLTVPPGGATQPDGMYRKPEQMSYFAAVAKPPERQFYSSSSCGACGKSSLQDLKIRGAMVTSEVRVERRVLTALPQALRQAQTTFQKTGGVHASGLFTASGALLALREDVGRHNALDKLIGWALNVGLVPLSEHVLLLSGRVSYELVQKSIAAGIPIVAAIGAPSSLAVELSEEFGLTLVGFLGADSMNTYTRAARITV